MIFWVAASPTGLSRIACYRHGIHVIETQAGKPASDANDFLALDDRLLHKDVGDLFNGRAKSLDDFPASLHLLIQPVK